jgi:hypothetical protein
MLDYAVIGSRLHQLYDWSAHELGSPQLSELIHDGAPAYAWPIEQRQTWDPPPLPPAARALKTVTAPRPPASGPPPAVSRGRSQTP